MSRSLIQSVLPFDDSSDLTHARPPRATPPPRRTGERRLEPSRSLDPRTPTAPIAFVLVRSPRARRYILRLRPDGVVRVTIPLRGTRREALDVIERHRRWIERQWRQRMTERGTSGTWREGTRIFFRGQEVPLTVAQSDESVSIQFADQVVSASLAQSVRTAVERHLRDLAARELAPRVADLALQHGLVVCGVTVRDQRTRWGSCSPGGRISLNWRLVQVPEHVRDYIVLHELMHLRQPNHSRKFWREVESVCPTYRDAESWLRRHGRSLWQ